MRISTIPMGICECVIWFCHHYWRRDYQPCENGLVFIPCWSFLFCKRIFLTGHFSLEVKKVHRWSRRHDSIYSKHGLACIVLNKWTCSYLYPFFSHPFFLSISCRNNTIMGKKKWKVCVDRLCSIVEFFRWVLHVCLVLLVTTKIIMLEKHLASQLSCAVIQWTKRLSTACGSCEKPNQDLHLFLLNKWICSYFYPVHPHSFFCSIFCRNYDLMHWNPFRLSTHNQ